MNDAPHSDQPSRSGCRLVGCLVAMGVVVSLIALLLPAIQAAREAERRNHCNNNLKQIGLGLQTYTDINKFFPYDARWGEYSSDELNRESSTQYAYHYPWSVNILPVIEAVPPDFNPINKRLAIWNQSQEFGSGGVSKVTPPAYFGYIQSQQVPPYRCPSEVAFTGPKDLPGLCMWTNYAGSVGVGFYSARLKEGDGSEGETTAPVQTRGLFAFNDPVRIDAVRDGTSQTIAVSEVTASGTAAPTTRNVSTYNGDLSDDLAIAADSDQPLPTSWSLRDSKSKSPWSPGPLLAGGSGKQRANLRTTPGGTTPVPMVFRASMVALTESVTGSGPCSLPNTYSAAQGGACGQPSDAKGTAGFELSGTVGQAPIVGIAPLYNALYSPNSNWPGPDSNHPGVVLAVFADGHSTTIQQRIDFSVWASLNTRAGSEAIDGDY
jgi:hypothetical protein